MSASRRPVSGLASVARHRQIGSITFSKAPPTRISVPIQSFSAHATAPSIQRLPRKRWRESGSPASAASAAREASVCRDSQGRSASVIPPAAARTRAAGAGRPSATSGRDHSTQLVAVGVGIDVQVRAVRMAQG